VTTGPDAYSHKITVIDSQTGDVWTFQKGANGSRVLQSSFTTSNTNGGYAVTFSDVYLSITRTNKGPTTSR
jgi:hypothetical protein